MLRKRASAWTICGRAQITLSRNRGSLVLDMGLKTADRRHPGCRRCRLSGWVQASAFVKDVTLAQACRTEGMLGLAEFLDGEFGPLLGLGIGVALGDVVQGLGHLLHELVAFGIVLGPLVGSYQRLLGAVLGPFLERSGGHGFLGGHGLLPCVRFGLDVSLWRPSKGRARAVYRM